MAAQDAPLALSKRRPVYGWCRVALVAVFLGWFAQFYRSGFGFTYVLMFNQERAESRIDTLRSVPIYVHPGAGYDGQFYAQLAVDPLLKNPSIDGALDSPPFRARRILFSWTAWVLGLGRPSWVVQAYSVQNVLAWLGLAWWLYRRVPGDNVPDVLVWCACLFGPGLLDSTRMALLDGPGLLVIVLGVEALERGRFWIGSVVLGIAGLARETNLLSSVALAPRRLTVFGIVRAIAGASVVLLPSLIWFDYLRSIYRSTATKSLDQLSVPFLAFVDAWHRVLPAARRSGLFSVRGLALLALVGITAQAAHMLIAPRWRHAWWRVGIMFVGLMLCIRGEIWLGAYERVLLPLTFAFNLSLPRSRGFWLLFALGNLGLASSVHLLLTASLVP